MTLDAVRHIFPPGMHCRLWLVGGSVRDRLRGETNQDADLIASCSPEELAAAGFHPVVSKSTGPIWFRSHPQLGKIEVTLLNREQSLGDELGPRDFRSNAVAMSLDGAVIDPLGCREDIEQRILRPCTFQPAATTAIQCRGGMLSAGLQPCRQRNSG